MSTPPRPSTWPLWVAAAAALIVLIVTFNTLADARSKQRQITMRQQDLRELFALMDDREGRMDVLAQLADDPTARDTLADLMQQHLPGIVIDRALRESAKGAQDWIIKRYDVRISQASPEQLRAFLAACEQARPPVRLIDLHVSAARDAGVASLQAQLTLVELTR